MLHQRYKDGIQWHDVPCFFRAPIICEVSCPFFSHMVHKYSFFSMLSHGAHALNFFCIFVSLYFFFIFLCVLSCRTLMSRWPIFCNFDFCIFVLFSSFFLNFYIFCLAGLRCPDGPSEAGERSGREESGVLSLLSISPFLVFILLVFFYLLS